MTVMGKAGLIAVGILATAVMFQVQAGNSATGAQARKPARTASVYDSERALRRLLVKDIVMHWGPYVSKVHGEDMQAWAARMVPRFRAAETQKLQRAARADTFNAMVNALIGQKSVDADVLEGLAPASIGDSVADLVFTPIESCMLVDTRQKKSDGTPVGGFKAGEIRGFKASGANFLEQGGSNTNCGIPSGVSTLLLNVQAVSSTSTGYFRMWSTDTDMPTASVLSYGVGTNAQNEIIQKVSQAGLSSDFNVQSAGNTHLVVNVLGYFAAPVAIAPECLNVSSTIELLGGGGVSGGQAVCPPEYTATNVGCSVGSDPNVVFLTGFGVDPTNNAGFCRLQNWGNPTTVPVIATCCRVPGR